MGGEKLRRLTMRKTWRCWIWKWIHYELLKNRMMTTTFRRRLNVAFAVEYNLSYEFEPLTL